MLLASRSAQHLKSARKDLHSHPEYWCNLMRFFRESFQRENLYSLDVNMPYTGCFLFSWEWRHQPLSYAKKHAQYCGREDAIFVRQRVGGDLTIFPRRPCSRYLAY
ncbi:hypothetical protein ACOSQ4_022161 [Xanthoceras sorbifolium]